MGLLDKFRAAKGEPKCSVCRATHSQIAAKARESGAVPIGKGVGICPKCRKAFCINHMIRADPHDWYSNEKCPRDGTDLDLNWDEPPTEDKPWRLGRVT